MSLGKKLRHRTIRGKDTAIVLCAIHTYCVVVQNFVSATGVSSMRGDTKVIEHLNKALRHELTAVNQYWLHYRLLDNWGYRALAKTWRKESIEEMQHADKLIERIIFLDGFPNMQTLESLHTVKR